MIFSKRNRSKIEDPSLLTLLFVAYFNCLTMIVYKLLNRHIPYIFHLCCFVFALIDRVNPLTLITSRFWLIRFIKIICFSLWCVPSLHCFLIPVFILQLIWLILIVPLYLFASLKAQLYEVNRMNSHLEAIEMEVIEKNWYFLCSNSERNEQHCEGSCGTEKIVFVVHTGENEFQTRRHERVNHKELAKSVERTTSGAIRMNKNWDESKYFRNNSTIPTRILRI